MCQLMPCLSAACCAGGACMDWAPCHPPAYAAAAATWCTCLVWRGSSLCLTASGSPCSPTLPRSQEELQQHRKTLRVALGSSQPPAPPPQQQPAPTSGFKGTGGTWAQPGSQQERQQGREEQQQQQQNGAGGGGSIADQVKNNPVISKYFAVRGDKSNSFG